ncbi:MAG: ribosomal protein S18-alanine N-acetyltransferase [Acidimicrobiales bacterium]|nr:ribosomal protein S18-alanine N-acetyltransferase [Acidimicrobiales bacterium]
MSKLADSMRDAGGPALDVRLAPMRRRHLRSVLRIESQVYPRPWSLGLFLSELGLKTSRVYVVARAEGHTVGYAGLMLAAGDGHITTIAVDPAWHRGHIGTRLLLVLAREAVARGCTALTLEVRLGNAPAQALYRRFGFAPAGIRKNYYTDTNEDAVVMWAHDVDQPAYAERLAAIEEGIPGTTVVEGFDR